MQKTATKLQVEEIYRAKKALENVILNTPLQKNEILSKRYECDIFLKREDLQTVRSFKIRGAYHFCQSLSNEERKNGVVCASAGNHAQGVAYSCRTLGMKGKIFMPSTTPRLKVSQVEMFGGSFIEVFLVGDTFDASYSKAKMYCDEHNMTFVHPFDDYRTIAGQATIGIEILEELQSPDYVFVGIGGGGLASGVGTYVKHINQGIKMVGVEPAGAPGMKTSLNQNKLVTLDHIEKFVDGAAVKQVGQLTMEICKDVLDDIVVVPEGKVCTTILEMYNQNAIVAEPAGALSIAALDYYKDEIKGKRVVCVISGGNNDIDRMLEIQERSLIYEGLKHYFIINFPQRAGALREFIAEVLGEHDDITRFEYTKKNNKDQGPVLVGIELKDHADYEPLIHRMDKKGFSYIEINKDEHLFQLLI